ncbi:MAG TPA: SDR family NAD(P)-dependent oxidoreductase, partial [Isosphaeraceae bacterium]
MAESNPVTIVTGASSGIGRATARALASSGHRVWLIARRRELLESLREEIHATGGVAHVAPADVADRAALHAATAHVIDHLGPVDTLVANAGYGVPTRLNPMNIEDIETTFRVNVLGMIYSIEAVLPAMIRRHSGQIVAVSSLAAYKGLPGESAYCASKAAVNTYMEGLRIELRNSNIKVATVCPGFVDTAMNDMDAAWTPMLMSPEAAGERVARVVIGKKSGVVRFPFAVAWLTDLVARMPDAIVARLVGHSPR